MYDIFSEFLKVGEIFLCNFLFLLIKVKVSKKFCTAGFKVFVSVKAFLQTHFTYQRFKNLFPCVSCFTRKH